MTRSLALLALILGVSAAAASASSSVGFYGCRTFVSKHPAPIVKPRSIVVACGDGNQYLTGIHWSSWTDASARGNGTLHYNDCTPNCAAGHFHTTRAAITLSKPAPCKGERVYTTLRAVWPGGNSGQSFHCE